MTFKEIMTELKKGVYRPIYFLMGDEPYFIDKITEFIAQNALTPDQKDFNQTVMYGKDANVALIDNTARRCPMMSEKMVVIVKEAQNVKNIENLVYYAQKPPKSTILVINYKQKTITKNSKLYKEIEKNGIIFESAKLYENKVPTWVTEYLDDLGYSIDPIATRMLVDNLGTDLSKISNEIDKLIIGLPQKSKITAVEIEKNIGISKDFNVFELQNALLRRDTYKSFMIANYLTSKENSGSMAIIISTLYNFFSKILIVHSLKDRTAQNVAKELKVHPFFVQDYLTAASVYNIPKLARIISYLRQFDLKSKGVDNYSADDNALAKELIYLILNG